MDDIAEGYYRAQAVGTDEPHVQLGTSSNGNDQVAIELKLLDVDRTVFTVLTFSDAAKPFAIERLKALGWKGGQSFDGITDNEVRVRAKRETYTDRTGASKTVTKFDIMTGAGFSFQAPMADKQKRAFFASLTNGAARPPSRKEAAPPPKDDDIPF